MKTITEISLKDGGSICLEVDPPRSAEAFVRVAKVGEIIDNTNVQLEAALAKIKPVARAIITTLTEPINAPDSVEVEFGIKLSAEANVIISATAIEGHFKISLKWKKMEPAD